MVSGSLPKAFRILRALADKGINLNIRELSAEVNMPKSTVHRICHLMVNEGVSKVDLKTKQYDWGQRNGDFFLACGSRNSVCFSQF